MTSSTPGGAYFATRGIAHLPDDDVKDPAEEAIFLLDTSWSQRAEAFADWLSLMQSILEQNEGEIRRFNVLMFNVEQRWWKQEAVENNPRNRSALNEYCQALVLEGATDLESALKAAVTGGDSGASPSLFLLSDASPSWGQVDIQSICDPVRGFSDPESKGTLFAYRMTGYPSDSVMMNALASASGGAVFTVDGKEDIQRAATAHRSRPWQLVKVSGKGTSEVLVAGGMTTIYPDQQLVVAGRGELNGPLKLHLRRGKETTTLPIEPESEVRSSLAARVYGGIAVDSLEPLGAASEPITIAFARQFRVPGRTCSMVMLESEADYERFNIKEADDPLVVQTTSVRAVTSRITESLAKERQNEKQAFINWTQSLERGPNPLLNRNTALRLAMEQLPEDAFTIEPKPLECRQWNQDAASDEYLEHVKEDVIDFDVVMREARRRMTASGGADALKVASTAVEAKASDPDTLRAVAFAAISWQYSDHAAGLLKRLVLARPYQPQSLLLLGECLSNAERADGALICYELVASGNWNERWHGSKPIAEIAMLHLLERISNGELETSVPAYCAARLDQLRDRWADEGLDVAIVMHWNTDRTDVDLHVLEPGGEECSYQNTNTKIGGAITQDITQGLGPEMYTLKEAPAGDFKISATYYRSDANRTGTPTTTLVSVYRNLGRESVSVDTQMVLLKNADDQAELSTFTVKQ